MFGVNERFPMIALLFTRIPRAVAVAAQTNQVITSSISGTLAHFQRKSIDLKMVIVLLSGGLKRSSWRFGL